MVIAVMPVAENSAKGVARGLRMRRSSRRIFSHFNRDYYMSYRLSLKSRKVVSGNLRLRQRPESMSDMIPISS